MIGETERVKRCALCGGELQDGNTTVPFLIGEKVAVIKNVPAEICSDCGEAYLRSSVVEQIEILLDRLEQLHFEMSVIQYEAA